MKMSYFHVNVYAKGVHVYVHRIGAVSRHVILLWGHRPIQEREEVGYV